MNTIIQYLVLNENDSDPNAILINVGSSIDTAGALPMSYPSLNFLLCLLHQHEGCFVYY